LAMYSKSMELLFYTDLKILFLMTWRQSSHQSSTLTTGMQILNTSLQDTQSLFAQLFTSIQTKLKLTLNEPFKFTQSCSKTSL